MRRIPLRERLFKLEDGITHMRPTLGRVTRIALVVVPVIAAVFLLWSTRYPSLDDTRSLALADVARNLATGHGFTTINLTPLSLHFIPRVANHPELAIMPVYAMVLSVWMRLFGTSDGAVAALSVLFYFISLAGLYFLARRWFDYPIAVGALLVAAMHLLLLQQAVQGREIPFVTCLVYLVFYVIATEVQRPTPPDVKLKPPSLTRPCLLSAFLLGIAVLTRFEMLAYVPVVAAFWFWRERTRGDPPLEPFQQARRSWILTGMFLLVFLLVLSPWVLRNWAITGHPMLTLRGYELLMATGQWPGQSLYRSFNSVPTWPTLAAVLNAGTVLGKIYRSVRFAYTALPNAINLYVLAIFLAGLMLSAKLWQEARVRWWILLALISQVGFMCFFVPSGGTVAPLLPLVILFAAATVSKGVREALAGTQIRRVGRSLYEFAALGALVLLVAYPLGDMLFVEHATGKSQLPHIVTAATAGSTLVASDIPQAVAWYAHHTAMLFPHRPDEYPSLREAGIAPDTVYFSPLLMRYPPEELVGYWQEKLVKPTPFEGYVPDKSWHGPGVVWRYKGGPGTQGPGVGPSAETGTPGATAAPPQGNQARPPVAP